MARGLVIGNVVNSSSGKPMVGAEVGITNIWGFDVNGPLVSYQVPRIEIKKGYPTERRPTDGNGIFKIPFSWDTANADNLGRVAGAVSLPVRVIVFPSQESKTFDGSAIKVVDGVQLIDNIKSGKLILAGSGQEILDKLDPALKAALSGQDLGSVPFTMLSVDQIAILGIMPNLSY